MFLSLIADSFLIGVMSNFYTAREKELILMVHVHIKKEYERLNSLIKIIRKNKLFYSTFSTEDKLQMEGNDFYFFH